MTTNRITEAIRIEIVPQPRSSDAFLIINEPGTTRIAVNGNSFSHTAS